MLALCREQRLEHRTKHIALRYFLARELQQRGQLRLAYVASEANTADVFTKALAPCDHQRCCTQLVMPFGLTNAPATFQMTMNKAFRPLLDNCVIIYLDDILVYSRDKQQHLADLEVVFTVLDKHGQLTKGSKCEFFQDGLEFLGHVISEAGVEIDPKKLDTVKAWHPPTNLTELQSFLGFVNYVRRFVPDMARLTAPLTDFLRTGVAFTWGGKEHAAFSTLKNVLCSPPVLRIAYPHRPFEVVTDASDIAIGAVLLQDFGNGL
ncbi:unnamed protein product [Closterium sp. NIES-54]